MSLLNDFFDLDWRKYLTFCRNCGMIAPHIKEIKGENLLNIMKKWTKRLLGLAASFALSAVMMQAMPSMDSASAASDYWKFDFGGGGTAGGYTGVSASNGYNASAGYGFSSGCSVSNVSASGSGALSDAVQFNNATHNGNATFCADVPNGLYQVTVWLGNTTRTSVAAEGMLQLINLTGNNATDTFQIPITDGQLNLCCVAGKSGYAFTLSALEIKRISDSTETNPTIWICGDSTVCNYYPLNSSAQAGWGQMLPSVLGANSGWQVRNMAASGQYAAGFVSAGQFAAIEKYGKAGDIYFISIGINDTNYSNETEYYNVVTDMAKRAMAKGMKVILVKQQGRDGDCSRNPLLTGRWFGGTLDRIGSELNLQVIDLFNLWQNHCLKIGASATTALYMSGDSLHPNRSGATVLAEMIVSQMDGSVTPGGAEFEDGSVYMLQNVNSGLYLTVEDGVAAAGTNVCQSKDSAPVGKNLWKMMSADDGYYRLYSMLEDGNTYLLDVYEGKAANGTNIGIYSDSGSTAQQFKLMGAGDNIYTIRTRVSDGTSCVEVGSALTTEGANVNEWESNGHDCQKWRLVEVHQNTYDAVYLQGDLNDDGQITATDISLMKRGMLSGFTDSAAELASDLNGDETVLISDAVLLIKQLMGEQVTFSDRKYYAIDAAYIEGWYENTNAGFTGEAYLNLNNMVGSAMTFTVKVPQAGNYLCTFNIANGSANDRQMMISVGGQSDVWLQSFLTTSAWTTWEERALVLPLTAGYNTISLVSHTAEGGPNVDFLRLTFTDEPIAEPYDPNQSGGPSGTPSDNPVVYIASDSTAQSYRESYAPQQGWGYYLGNYFNSNVTVSNHSIAGRSSKSFYDNGRLTTILDTIKAGDYLLVDFGINDGASSQPERYAPVCGNVDNPAAGSFEYYMTFYIKGALEKGATPILMSPTLSIKNQSQPFGVGYRNIDSACKMLAAKYQIPYFDLGQAMTTQFNQTAYNTVRSYYMGSTTAGGTDFTHFTETGANVVAKIVADGIKGLGLPLSGFVS